MPLIDRSEASREALAVDAAAIGHALKSSDGADEGGELEFRCPIGHRWRATAERFRDHAGACSVCQATLDEAARPPPPLDSGSWSATNATTASSTVAAAMRLLGALDPLLDLPRTRHGIGINAGHLRLLVMLETDPDGADRDRARELDGHDKPTVDARLKVLRSKGLVHPSTKSAYHDSWHHLPTPTGRLVVRRLLGVRAPALLVDALDRVCALPVERRETPATAAILSVLARAVVEPGGTTIQGVMGGGVRRGTKPSARGRLKWLEERGLIECVYGFNAGGGGGGSNPNLYRAEPAGCEIVADLAPGRADG